MNEPQDSPRLHRLVRDFLKDTWEFYPTWASHLGLHQYDGLMPDLSESAIASRISQLKAALRDLTAIRPAHLKGEDYWDYQLFSLGMGRALWEITELRPHLTNPISYISHLTADDYVKRDYAPLEVRARALAHLLSQVPRFVQVMKDNLSPSEVAPEVAGMAIEVFEGILTLYEKDLPQALQPVASSSVAADFELARVAAADSVRGLVEYLKQLRVEAGGNFAIGADNFAKMLRLGEMVELPLEQVLKIGEEDLRRNLALFRETAARIDSSKSPAEVMDTICRNHPTADRLIPETASVLEDIRRYLVDHQIISIPSEVRCQVAETPSFMRWAFAALDAPGPFEAVSTEAYYYVTPVEPHWSPQQAQEWLKEFSYHSIKNVSIHEAYPGHYTQFLHAHQVTSLVSKVFRSYAFSEGWAHYAEELMQEQGYGGGDPRLRLAQLSDALTRNCRHICSIKLHTGEMSLEEATRFFMDNVCMERLPASKEALRGTFDPGYLNYTLGKLLIMELQRDYKNQQGPKFNVKDFHDTALSFGYPPIPLLRQRMLRDHRRSDQ